MAALLAFTLAPTRQASPSQPLASSYTLQLKPFAEHTGDNAIDLTHAGDGTGRVFVSTQSGQVFVFDQDGSSLGVFLDLPTARPDFLRSGGAFTGLMYIAFHPDYAKPGSPGEGRFYTGHQVALSDAEPDFDSKDHGALGDSDVRFVVGQWQVHPDNPDRIDPASYRQVLLINFHTTASNPHALGELAFNPYAKPGDTDYGNLYIAVGDSNNRNESGATNLAYTQRSDNPFAKILRIDPLGDGEQPYTVPADNPYTADGLAEPDDGDTPRTVPFAIGLRNAQSFSFARDLDGNSVIVAFDIGASLVEEINLVRAGHNYGWDRLEGTGTYDPSRELLSPSRPPAAQYDHAFPTRVGEEPSGGPAAVIGGFVVSDPGEPLMRGQVVCADLVRGTFFHTSLHEMLEQEASGKQATLYLMQASLGQKRGTFADLIDQNRADARFGIDEKGRVYLVSKQTQTIYKTSLTYTGEPIKTAAGALARPEQAGLPWPLLIGVAVMLGLIGGFLLLMVRQGGKQQDQKKEARLSDA